MRRRPDRRRRLRQRDPGAGRLARGPGRPHRDPRADRRPQPPPDDRARARPGAAVRLPLDRRDRGARGGALPDAAARHVGARARLGREPARTSAGIPTRHDLDRVSPEHPVAAGAGLEQARLQPAPRCAPPVSTATRPIRPGRCTRARSSATPTAIRRGSSATARRS